jgi:hypothetical protein
VEDLGKLETFENREPGIGRIDLLGLFEPEARRKNFDLEKVWS